MKVVSHQFEVSSEERLDLIDLTQKVRELFNGSMVKEGMLYLHSMHTTTAIMINEWQQALLVVLLLELGVTPMLQVYLLLVQKRVIMQPR